MGRPKKWESETQRKAAYRAKKREEAELLKAADDHAALMLGVHTEVVHTPEEEAELARVFTADRGSDFTPARPGSLISADEYRDRVRGMDHVISLNTNA